MFDVCRKLEAGDSNMHYRQALQSVREKMMFGTSLAMFKDVVHNLPPGEHLSDIASMSINRRSAVIFQSFKTNVLSVTSFDKGSCIFISSCLKNFSPLS